MLKKTLFATLLITIGISSHSFGQASLVPVYHQVYDWLYYQRVRGNAPLYAYESLPLTRGQVTEVLAGIDESALNRGDQQILHSYLREFSTDSLRNYKKNSLIEGEDTYFRDGKFFSGSKELLNRTGNLVFSEEEPHLYVWDDEKASIAFDIFFGPGAVFVEDGDAKYSSPYYTLGGIRSYGTFAKTWGFHYEQWRAVDQIGDDEAFDYLPFLSRNWKNLRDVEPLKNHLEAFAGYHKNYWSLHVGRGTLKYGVGQRNSLVFSRKGIPFDWVRLNINSKYVDYSLIQGSLSSETVTIPLEGYPDQYTRTSPDRWVVHQKITFQPINWISFGFYEIINYSNRGLELAYLNPITRLSLTEWEQQDQDNGFAGFEGTLRPVRGLEIFGEILIDDLHSAKDVFIWDKNEDVNSIFARYVGLSYALKTGTVFNASYQRVEPNVYAHKFKLNTHAEKGIGLGSQVGPNGSELSLGIEQWLSHRTRIQFRYDYDQHGLNTYDSNGNLTEDFGGDIMDSYYIDPDTGQIIRAYEFLAGDLHRWNRFNIAASYEPWRAFKFTLEYSYRQMLQGTEMSDLSVFNFTIQVGY